MADDLRWHDPRLVDHALAWMHAKTLLERAEILLWCVLNPPPRDWPHGLTEWAYFVWWQDKQTKH